MVAQAAGAVPVATAGGTAVGNLGTSSPAVLSALRAALAASGGDGVVVLLDLGSAFLATEMALDELRPAERRLVRVSSGPLVEGAVLAAVEALSGAPLERVLAAANGALRTPKLPDDWAEADAGDIADAALAARWIRLAAARIREGREWLTELDAAIGDGDHGINLDRGFAFLVARLDAGELPVSSVGALVTAAGRAITGTVGGASGALYGRALQRAGTLLAGVGGDGRPAAAADVAAALDAAVDGIVALGHAAPGEKTMLDALVPARDAFRAVVQAGVPLARAAARAADAAERGAQATVPMLATKGRASYLGERSIGHLDPGAASSALLLRALADTLAEVTTEA
jgi:dihydroxyacetone kinase-like protein